MPEARPAEHPAATTHANLHWHFRRGNHDAGRFALPCVGTRGQGSVDIGTCFVASTAASITPPPAARSQGDDAASQAPLSSETCEDLYPYRGPSATLTRISQTIPK
jgi:hypothetical protein